jgi:hypothetical protein
MVMKTGIPVVIAAFIMSSPAALAAEEPSKQPPVASAPCEAAPSNGKEAPNPQGTDKISRCEGVLKPPATDDPMEKQPPQQGNTPVIRPEELPPQQKPQ